MAEFQYVGNSSDGKRISGRINCSNEGEARMLLRAQGVRPTSITKPGLLQADLGTLFRGGSGKPISNNELVTFTNLLQVLIGSGVPIIQSLDIIISQTKDSNSRNHYITVREKVGQGGYLSDSMSSLQGIFPRVYTSLIKAGESSGSLDIMLGRLTTYLERIQKITRTVKGALVYPAVLIGAGILTIIFMLEAVVPKIAELLKSTGQTLPKLTLNVIAISDFVQTNIIVIVGGISLLLYVGIQYTKSTEGRRVYHAILYSIPGLGDALRKSAISRFSRTLSTLLTSGLPLIEAMEVCRNSVDSAPLEEALGKMRREVEAGKPVASVVSRQKVFPSMVSQMIEVGESTGNLDKMLERIADFYDEEVAASVSILTKMIEPILILVMGLVIGVLVLAMYLPLLEVSRGV